MARANLWTADEVETLVLLYPVMSTTDIARLVNRTTYAIKAKAGRLGLDSGKRCGADMRIWTVNEERRFQTLWSQGASVREIAHVLDRSETAIKKHRKRLQLSERHRRVTPAEQNQIVRLARGGRSSTSIARELNRNPCIINHYRRLHGVPAARIVNESFTR